MLLISSSRNKSNWIIPGGSIEHNENPEDAAEREVYEEAGVKGRLGRLLGIFEVFEVYFYKLYYCKKLIRTKRSSLIRTFTFQLSIALFVSLLDHLNVNQLLLSLNLAQIELVLKFDNNLISYWLISRFDISLKSQKSVSWDLYFFHLKNDHCASLIWEHAKSKNVLEVNALSDKELR